MRKYGWKEFRDDEDFKLKLNRLYKQHSNLELRTIVRILNPGKPGRKALNHDDYFEVLEGVRAELAKNPKISAVGACEAYVTNARINCTPKRMQAKYRAALDYERWIFDALRED